MSKRKATLLVGLTVLGNCLGNLSSDLIRCSARSVSKIYVSFKQQGKLQQLEQLLAKEKMVRLENHS
jgi:uncharacterized membrane protein affecting hemolysin expression